ncbi:MAG: HyaD/HybD family hydrogenase maturation endopeptidase [candidate division Zixibacteria bacterium]|nr:HyaD/HybD family hydrogenase maturation endopeptidase [candidate division Zixibacteria bacterium]
MKKKILIAGIGNLLFTDEGIGVHIIRELSKNKLPEYVELAEIGTATFELERFIEGKDKVIIVDAIASDEPPGTIYKLTPDDLKSEKRKLLTSLHQYGVVEALESASLMGIKPEMIIFGITPKDYHTPSIELTPELKRSLPEIVEAILNEIAL